MHVLISFSALAAEPASVLYLLTGAATLAVARFRRNNRITRESSTLMLICKPDSRTALKSLNLL